jgi:hypothetical protein
MNMLKMKEHKTYQRKSDSRFFKKQENKYFIANDKGVWNETTDLSLNDEFIERPVNFKKSLKDLYKEYKTGEVSVSGKAFDQLLLRLCELGDEI